MPQASGTLYWLPTILAAPDLDATDVLLLIGLADHVDQADEAFVGLRRLATYARCSYGTARRRLADLEARGYLSRTPRLRADGGRSTDLIRLVRARFETDPPLVTVNRGPRAPRCAGGPARPDARAEVPTVEPTTPDPHDGRHKSCRACGTNPRATGTTPRAAAAPSAPRLPLVTDLALELPEPMPPDELKAHVAAAKAALRRSPAPDDLPAVP